MDHYTLQQRIGSVRFSPRVLIGNWNEEARQKEALLTELALKKAERLSQSAFGAVEPLRLPLLSL